MADIDDMDLPDPSLKNILDQESLQWVFVGGKGGVGKTTTSCCLGVQLAKCRKKVRFMHGRTGHAVHMAFQGIGEQIIQTVFSELFQQCYHAKVGLLIALPCYTALYCTVHHQLTSHYPPTTP